ncbi:MAG TPA: antitoxin VapB family protein [Candidatus Nanoarchaeia archaeon]|nr:antitoxin VapB family protein [Candidatus Nanoarchaeia archaeon]
MVKTITITEEAYNKLAWNKDKGESFSEMINRSFANKEDMSKLIGAWKEVNDTLIEEMKNGVERRRKTAGRERMKEVLRSFD